MKSLPRARMFAWRREPSAYALSFWVRDPGAVASSSGRRSSSRSSSLFCAHVSLELKLHLSNHPQKAILVWLRPPRSIRSHHTLCCKVWTPRSARRCVLRGPPFPGPALLRPLAIFLRLFHPPHPYAPPPLLLNAPLQALTFASPLSRSPHTSATRILHTATILTCYSPPAVSWPT